MFETEKAWKNLTITNKVFKMFCMIQENAFITKYKNALINKKTEEEGYCRKCNVPATLRHILLKCQLSIGMTIKRHDCVVDEIYNKIIEVKLNNKYNRKIKWHKLNNVGFIQSGKTLRKIGNFEDYEDIKEDEEDKGFFKIK